MLDALLAGNNEVSVAALCVLWPLCCHMQSQSLRKVAVSHLRHAQRLPDVASRVAGVQVTCLCTILLMRWYSSHSRRDSKELVACRVFF